MPGLETTGWHQPPQKELYNPPLGTTWGDASQGPNPPTEPKQRILGLSVKVFWIVIVLLVIIVAAGIGGGVGGGLASRSRADSSM